MFVVLLMFALESPSFIGLADIVLSFFCYVRFIMSVVVCSLVIG